MTNESSSKPAADYFRNYQSPERWIELQDNFARAWLDGYTVGEDE